MTIPFNRPHLTHREMGYIAHAHALGALSGDGPYTKKCHTRLQEVTGAASALLTHSCTAALEMMAILADIAPGDEVIMPSYTFVSTANAFVLRGGVPIFVDVREDTLNLDETKVEAAITERTRAIVAVHYAGVACDMDALSGIAERHGLLLLEDAAQAFLSTYKGRPLGGLGHMAAFSFHETKNVISGEGGALLVNDPRYSERAEIIREKGTNRSKFFRGETDKYSWVDVGSSFLPSEIVGAFLYAQLEEATSITRCRLDLWARYHEAFLRLEVAGHVRRPVVPEYCEHNAHMYYLLCQDADARSQLIDHLKRGGVHSVFHYVPLHSSPAGLRYARTPGSLDVTQSVADRLVRLPLFVDLTQAEADRVVDMVTNFFGSRG